MGEGTAVVEVDREVRGLAERVGGVADGLGRLTAAHEGTREELAALRGQVAAFLRRDELDRARALAQTRLLGVRRQLGTEFGRHDGVRRDAVGILRAMDTGLVGQDLVRSLSDELMTSTPRYWLAPALVGLGAWLRDDQDLADRALAEATRRDHDRTALFYAFVLHRRGRDEAVARWVGRYVDAQDPTALGAEFRVVLDATTSGVLGAATRPVVLATIARWHVALTARPELVEAQVARWHTILGGMRTPVDGGFPTLAATSPSWPAMAEAHARAGVHGHALTVVDNLYRGEVAPPPDLAARIDAVLDGLTGDLDPEEAPLRRRAEELEALLVDDGDAPATAERDLAAPPARPVDFLTLVSDAAFAPEGTSRCRGTQRLAVALSRSWASAASERLENEARACAPSAIVLEYDGWRGRIDPTVSEGTLLALVADHMNRRTEGEASAVRIGRAAVAAAGASALLAVLGAVLIILGVPTVGAGSLVLAALPATLTLRRLAAVPRRRERIRQAGARRREYARGHVAACFAEASRWRHEFATSLADGTALRARLHALVPDDHVAPATPAIPTREVSA